MPDFPKATDVPTIPSGPSQQMVLPGQEPAVYASDVDPNYTWGDDKQPRQICPCSFCECGGIVDPGTHKCRKCGVVSSP